MKRRLIIALAALMVFGLAIAAVAFSSSPNVATVAACCCCSGESCPMKNKDAIVKEVSAKDTASCCEGCQHCKGGAESCPMMKDGVHAGDDAKGAHSCPMMKNAAHKDGVKADTAIHSERTEKAGAMSCPMKDKTDMKLARDAVVAEPVAAADKKGCGCACCAGHAEKQTVPAV